MDIEIFYLGSEGYYELYGSNIRLGSNATVKLKGRLAGYVCRVDCGNYSTAFYNLTFECTSPDQCDLDV